MKSEEIVKLLELKGYEVKYGDYEYWSGIPYIKHDDGSTTWLVKQVRAFDNSLTVETDLAWYKVERAIKEKCGDINEVEGILLEEQISKKVENEML